MTIDGLRTILEKEEVVPTRLARDFLENSQVVDDIYKHHVRTYIPLQTGSDEASGVNDFAKRFIQQVKDARAPRGYITADFGYGKTSAGLFVWQKAQDARLIAIPPFKLNRLEDLLDATAGWLAYIFDKNVPHLVQRVVEIYKSYHDRELKTIAERYGMTLAQAERMYEDQALQLNITPKDIVRFFVQMTELTKEAGYEGLIVIPDELQQYLEPEIKSGKADPLVPLFDIITDLMNYQGKLPFGLLMIITAKELGIINDQRGDLIDRMRGNTLDLRVIYDREFPTRLWKRFAETFDYSDIEQEIVDHYTLDSLGQLSSRQDLSNGPRTVINAFRRIAQTALESSPNFVLYTPINLINDFLTNKIAFDARKVLQETANRALAASFVRGHQDLETAVKLLAAFPVDGATRDIQLYYSLIDACSELKASGFPELVVEVGDRNKPALMLRGLDQAQENMDELSLLLREFIRSYQPLAANQIERAVNTFLSLLKMIFKSENWSVAQEEQRLFAHNAEMVLTGAFPKMIRQFPERVIHIRVLGDDETIVKSHFNGECTLNFILHRHFELESQDRQTKLGNLELDFVTYTADFHLNLMLSCFDALNRGTQDQLRRVVDIEQINVLMTFALYDFLQRATERNSVSKPLKEMLQRSMMVRLLEAAIEVLLNPAVGMYFNVAGGRIVEDAVGQLIKERYGDQYQTLITYKQWRDSLRNYIAALNQLPSFAQKQGFTIVEGTKEEIAKLFGASSTGFDTFHTRFPGLISIEGGTFPSRAEAREGRQSGVRFTRHLLEEIVLDILENAQNSRQEAAKAPKTLHLNDIQKSAEKLGYRRDEIEYALEIMQARDLIEIEGGWIRENPRPEISIEELNEQIHDFKREAEMLFQASQQRDAELMLQRAQQYLERFKNLDESRDETALLILAEQARSDIELLRTFVRREFQTIREEFESLEITLLPSDAASALAVVIEAGTLSTDINQSRLEYEHLLKEWNKNASTYKQNVIDLRLSGTAVGVASMQQIQQRIKQLKGQRQELDKQKQILIQATQKAKLWQEVGEKFNDLAKMIHRLGKPGELLRTKLQETERTILEAFYDRPDEAFNSVGRFQRQLSQLEQEVDGFLTQAEREFNQLQDQYRNILNQKAGIDPQKLWQKIIYSSNNPDGVYANLKESLERQVSDLLDNLARGIEQSKNNLFTIEMMNNDQQGIAEQDLENIKASLESLDKGYTLLSEQATPAVIHNINQLDNWLEKLMRLAEGLHQVQETSRKLRERPQQPTISPTEQIFLDAVTRFPQNGLVYIRKELGNLTDDSFWELIRSMWERQLIQINLHKFDD